MRGQDSFAEKEPMWKSKGLEGWRGRPRACTWEAEAQGREPGLVETLRRLEGWGDWVRYLRSPALRCHLHARDPEPGESDENRS